MLSTFGPTAQNFGRLPRCWGQVLGSCQHVAYAKTTTSGPLLITLGHKSTLQYLLLFQFWPSSNKTLRSPPPDRESCPRHQTMPGTIQVSVLELMDLPPPLAPCQLEDNSSFVYLKVVMGKKEYQSVGGGDFSFPVTSLHENLILMLHDMEGNLISRTEFKTRSVVEKGISDDVFPLEGGGSVHMKLQFVLSEEERQRIREMRYSALKRKRMELLKGGCESHVSELTAEGDGIGQLKQIDPDAPDFAGVDVERNKTQATSGDIKERQLSSCEGLDPHIGCLGSPISGNVTKDDISVSAESDDHIYSLKRKNLRERGSSSSVRKMISAFENSLFKGTRHRVDQGTTSQLSKIESGGSLKRTSSEQSDIRKLKFPQTMAKSFSAEMLSEMDRNPMVIRSSFVKKQGVQHLNNATRQEMIGNNSLFRNFTTNQNLKSLKPVKQKSVGGANDESSSLESLHTAQPHNSGNIDTVLEPVKTANFVSFGDSAEHIGKRKEPISVKKKINMDSFPKECHSLIACTVQKSPGERSSIYNGEKLKALDSKQKPFETEQRASLGGSVGNVTEREDYLASEIGRSPSIISKHRKSSAFQEKPKVNIFLKEAPSLDAHTASKTSGEMSSFHGGAELEALGTRNHTTDERNPREEKTNDDGGITKQNVSDYFRPYDELDFLHKTDVSRDTDEPSSLCTYNRGSALNALANESDWTCYISHMEEQIIPGNSNELLELLSSYREKCFFGKVGVWEPHHLCITTGSKQLRNLVESCSLCLGTLPSEKNPFTVEANKKQKMHREVTRNKKFSGSSEKFNHENKVSNSNFKGMLIEQPADSFMKSPTRMSNIISYWSTSYHCNSRMCDTSSQYQIKKAQVCI
uniref:Uncharacterized protein LOC105059534 isoform X2 n=1 Tax=Elaeis guineensis var. tenera TaxID=51953 RepID=A0A8N4ICK4_ELAGV|nr:uncharacterized protein LOC105059534 isoform X2 [Elaeis guineensis]